jgi:crotonobetainyl-CoA:carnitine CoA-transferase CaiB-like acyl-CoA transferase
VPAGPVQDVNAMHADPQTLAREMVVEVQHSRLGPVRTLALPIKLSRTPGGPRHGAPLYGGQSREVLGELGYAATEIEALLAAGAVRGPEAA